MDTIYCMALQEKTMKSEGRSNTVALSRVNECVCAHVYMLVGGWIGEQGKGTIMEHNRKRKRNLEEFYFFFLQRVISMTVAKRE